MPRSTLEFCIIRAAEALDHIQKQTCSDTLSVYVLSGPSLSLDFEKWDGDESFVFKAGVYGDDTRLRYEISSGQLTALDSNIIKIEGMNAKGKLVIGKVTGLSCSGPLLDCRSQSAWSLANNRSQSV